MNDIQNKLVAAIADDTHITLPRRWYAKHGLALTHSYTEKQHAKPYIYWLVDDYTKMRQENLKALEEAKDRLVPSESSPCNWHIMARAY